jgi:hypothetical protein
MKGIRKKRFLTIMMCLALMVSICVPKAHASAAGSCGCSNPMPRYAYITSFPDSNYHYFEYYIYNAHGTLVTDGSGYCTATFTVNVYRDFCANCNTELGEHPILVGIQHEYLLCNEPFGYSLSD